MSSDKNVSFYLPPGLLEQGRNNANTFLNIIKGLLTSEGFDVGFFADDEEGLLRQAQDPGYAFVERQTPINDRTLCLRVAYFRPFWHIERSPARWEWPVVNARYVEPEQAQHIERKFFKQWQTQLFFGAPEATKEGFVFVPLQGRLTVQRSFQSMSPIQMVETLAEAFSDRQVVITEHPGESYSESEKDALKELTVRHRNVLLGHSDDTETFLKQCDLVATQNSSLAFHGYFYRKPALFFGLSDCHHIGASVPRDGLEEAIKRARQSVHKHIKYESYLYWYWQTQSVNAGRDDASDKIRQALIRAGWPLSAKRPEIVM